MAAMGAAEVIYDERVVKKPELLLEATRRLARSPKKREELGAKLHEMARPGAAGELAEIILKVKN